jgi:hypothetical protein
MLLNSLEQIDILKSLRVQIVVRFITLGRLLTPCYRVSVEFFVHN